MKFKQALFLGLILTHLILRTESFPGFAAFKVLGSVAGKSYKAFGTTVGHMHKGLIVFNLVSIAKDLINPQDPYEKVLYKIEKISEKVDQLSSRMDYQFTKLDKVVAAIPDEIMVNQRKQDLANAFVQIDNMYEKMALEAQNRSSYSPKLMKLAAKKAIKKMPNLLKKLGNAISPAYVGFSAGFFSLIAKTLALQEKEACNTGEPPDYSLYNMFVSILLLDIKGFTTLCSAYEFMYHVNNETTRPYIHQATVGYETRIESYTEAVIQAMKTLPRFIRTCDPPQHIRNETWVAFEGAIQTFLINDKNYHNHGYTACYGNCEELGTVRQRGRCEDNSAMCFNSRPCVGTIRDCWTIEKDGDFCFEKNGEFPARYQWYRNPDITFGKPSEDCRGYGVSLYAWLYSGYYCQWCTCKCVDNVEGSKAIYKFSTNTVYSDYNKNKVVTGVKFTLQDSVIHVQIQQGELVDSGSIKDGTVEWVALPEAHMFEYSILDVNKKLQLTDLLVPKDRVVVGVRLYCDDEACSNNLIRLRVAHAKFDYLTGEIDQDADVEILDDEDYSDEVVLQKRNNPTTVSSAEVNHIDSEPGQYVRFDTSKNEEDFGQSTIPFCDSQPLFFTPSLAVGGVGLYHRGSIDSSGFVGLRLFPLDLVLYKDEEVQEF